MELAGELKNLNEARKDMTAKYVEKAISLIEGNMHMIRFSGIYTECHGIAGIIAGRIREKIS